MKFPDRELIAKTPRVNIHISRTGMIRRRPRHPEVIVPIRKSCAFSAAMDTEFKTDV
jgi:hypothetical protein